MDTMELPSDFPSVQERVLGLLLIVLTMIVYAPTLEFDFLPLWDDQIHVHANPLLHPVTADTWRRLWTEPYEYQYNPVSYSVWAGVALATRWWCGMPPDSRLEPILFRVLNLGLHVAAVLLVYAILLRLVARRQSPTGQVCAAVGTLLFALHPLQVEVVAWVSGLRELLAAVFTLAAVRLFICWHDIADERRFHRSGHWWLATLCLLLAVGSKPSAVTTGLLAGSLVGVVRWRRTVVALLPWVLIGVAWSALTDRWALTQPLMESVRVPWYCNPLIAADAVAFYLRRVVYPWPLLLDYGRTPASVMASGWAWWSWLLPAGLLAVLLFSRRHPYLKYYAAFVVTLLPVLGLVPFNFQSVSTVAGRYAYVAMIAPAGALAYFLRRRSRHPAWFTLAMMGLAVLGTSSRYESQRWRDGEHLFAHTARYQPASWKALHSHGFLLNRRGAYAEAIPHYEQALRIAPDRPEILTDYAICLANLGRHSAAAPVFERAFALGPTRKTAWNLALARAQLDDVAGELEALRRLLRLDPSDRLALHRAAWIMATSTAEELRDGGEALRLAQALTALPDDGDGKPYVVLAAALAETEAFEAAEGAAQKAASRFEKAGDEDRLRFTHDVLIPALRSGKRIRE